MHETVLRNSVTDLDGEGGADAWQHLEEIEIPVVVAWGKLDMPFLSNQCTQLVKRLPNAADQALFGVTHLPYLEAPGLIADLICGLMVRL